MDLSITNSFDQQKNVWDVTVIGEIDIFNSPEFKSKLISLLEEKQTSISINCEELSYIDSTGLGALIAVLKKTKEFGGDIYLHNVKPTLFKLLRITNLDKVLKIEGEKDEQ